MLTLVRAGFGGPSVAQIPKPSRITTAANRTENPLTPNLKIDLCNNWKKLVPDYAEFMNVRPGHDLLFAQAQRSVLMYGLRSEASFNAGSSARTRTVSVVSGLVPCVLPRRPHIPAATTNVAAEIAMKSFVIAGLHEASNAEKVPRLRFPPQRNVDGRVAWGGRSIATFRACGRRYPALVPGWRCVPRYRQAQRAWLSARTDRAAFRK